MALVKGGHLTTQNEAGYLSGRGTKGGAGIKHDGETMDSMITGLNLNMQVLQDIQRTPYKPGTIGYVLKFQARHSPADRAKAMKLAGETDLNTMTDIKAMDHGSQCCVVS